MSSRTTAILSVLAPVALLAAARPVAPTKVQLTVATLHAAALTTSREAGDSTDAPYLLVSILGPRTTRETIQIPASAHLNIHRDEALGARPLAELSLEPGDSVRLLVSVLENSKVRESDEALAASLSTQSLVGPASARVDQLTRAVAPLTKQGAHWLGSLTLLLTNEGGSMYWRRLECVASCKVVSAPGATALTTGQGAPIAGVVELSGGGGTYHLQLQGKRTP